MTALLRVLPVALFTLVLSEHVPPPVNLSVQALNTDYTLHWNWFGENNHTATFTVQSTGLYQIKRDKNRTKWRTACEETTEMSCDLAPVHLHYLGIHRLQVRATVNGQRSAWASCDFAPFDNAEVGPPTNVTVSVSDHNLQVSITEPQTSSKTSMKDLISSLQYRYYRWERDANHNVLHVDSPSTMVVLEDLKPWTWYCVSVQSRTTEPNKTSVFTDPVCISTKGGFQWGTFIWVFGISLFLALAIVLGVVLLCFYGKKILQSSVAHPVFLDDNWHFPPMAVSLDGPSEQCDPLTVTSSEKQLHSSVEHESDSGSGSDSQDSGTYTMSNESTSEQSTNLQRSHKGSMRN